VGGIGRTLLALGARQPVGLPTENHSRSRFNRLPRSGIDPPEPGLGSGTGATWRGGFQSQFSDPAGEQDWGRRLTPNRPYDNRRDKIIWGGTRVFRAGPEFLQTGFRPRFRAVRK